MRSVAMISLLASWNSTGEASSLFLPDDFFLAHALRQPRDEYEVLLIVRRVQKTGMGRTGKLWGVDHWNGCADSIITHTSAQSAGGVSCRRSFYVYKPEIWIVIEQ